MSTMMNLPHLGLLYVSGKNAKTFLQGQLTCDLEAISSQRVSLGAHCNPQGRIISLFRLCWFQDGYFLQMPIDLLPIARAALNKYATLFRLNCTDVSHDFEKWGMIGPPLPGFPEEMNEARIIDNCLVICHTLFLSRYKIIGRPHDIDKFKKRYYKTETASEINWKQLNIEAGIPTIYPETSEKFLPHEINLPALGGVSFKKGCYTGQEIIARMEYLGKLKNRMFNARVTTTLPILRGHDIYRLGGTPCGSIVDYVQAGIDKYELLVVAPEDMINKAILTLDSDHKVPLEFVGN